MYIKFTKDNLKYIPNQFIVGAYELATRGISCFEEIINTYSKEQLFEVIMCEDEHLEDLQFLNSVSRKHCSDLIMLKADVQFELNYLLETGFVRFLNGEQFFVLPKLQVPSRYGVSINNKGEVLVYKDDEDWTETVYTKEQEEYYNKLFGRRESINNSDDEDDLI